MELQKGSRRTALVDATRGSAGAVALVAASAVAAIVLDASGRELAAGGGAGRLRRGITEQGWTVRRVLYAGPDVAYADALAQALTALREQGLASLDSAWMVLRLHARLQAGQMLPAFSAARRVTRSVALPPPEGYSEAELWAHTVRVRSLETTPPHFTRYPVGTLAWDDTTDGADAEVAELRAYPLDDPRLDFGGEAPPTGGPVVEKYAAWIGTGSLPPPARAVERGDGQIRIIEGRHRWVALRLAGRTAYEVWVSPTWNKPVGNGETCASWITRALVEQWATVVRPWPQVLDIAPEAS